MNIKAVRGMQDLLPERQEVYRRAEDTIRGILAQYGYREIGLPTIEPTELFQRLVGEATDIVEKEMYTFEDRSGDSITLRPEGTAGCVRAAQENGLLFNQVQRLWYSGAMFRYERPQKGRFRQFAQIGAECFGMPGPDVDAELLFLTVRIWEALGILGDLSLELNSMGSLAARERYRSALVTYLGAHVDGLDPDSRKRLETNPLRILDSKDEGTQRLLNGAPGIIDFLDDESRAHLDGLRRLLDRAQVPYSINPRIVRGLDYYNKTVFEWTTGVLGSQGTVCGGGRYDGLVEELGGRPTPAVGFAIGVDRVVLMMERKDNPRDAAADLYVASIGDAARSEALLLAERLRRRFADLRITVDCSDAKFRGQLKQADRSGAFAALILGDDEVAEEVVTVKALRRDTEQERVPVASLEAYLDHLKDNR